MTFQARNDLRCLVQPYTSYPLFYQNVKILLPTSLNSLAAWLSRFVLLDSANVTLHFTISSSRRLGSQYTQQLLPLLPKSHSLTTPKNRSARNSKPLEVLGKPSCFHQTRNHQQFSDFRWCMRGRTNRNLWPNTQTASPWRRQALQRHSAWHRTSKILAWSWSATVRSGVETVIDGTRPDYSGSGTLSMRYETDYQLTTTDWTARTKVSFVEDAWSKQSE